MRRSPLILILAAGSVAFNGCSQSDSNRDESSVSPSGNTEVAGSLAVGTSTDKKEVVGGTKVTMKDPKGSEVTSTTTDDSGNFKMVVPGSIAIDASTSNAAALLGTSYTIDSTVADDGSGKALGISQPISLDLSKASANNNGLVSIPIGSFSFSEIGAITGTVAFEDKTIDAAGADVYIPGKSFFVRTDKSGDFQLLYVPEGQHTVRIEKGNYYKTVDVTVTNGKTTKLGDVSIALDARNPPPLSSKIIGTWTTKCWDTRLTETTTPVTGKIVIRSETNFTITGSVCLSDKGSDGNFTYFDLQGIYVLSDGYIRTKVIETTAGNAVRWRSRLVTSYTGNSFTVSNLIADGVEVFTRVP